jgi:hypothetical protein
MKVTIKGNKLVIEMDINKDPQPSKSGKTLIVASSGGNVTTDTEINDKQLVVGVNAYIYND